MRSGIGNDPTDPLYVSVTGGGGSGGGAVTIANGADVAQGSTTDAPYSDRTGAAAGTEVAILKGLFANGIYGNVASGSADSGNPVKVAGVYNSTLPTFTTGQRADAQLDANGNLRVYPTYAIISGNDGQSNNSLGRPGGNTIQGNQILPITGNYYFNGTSWDRQRGDTNGAYSVSKGSNTLTTAQVSVATTSTQIVAARAGRGSVKITNLGTTDVFIGNTGVTTTTGDLLPGTKGASIVVPTNAAVFGVASGAAQTVSVMEVY